MLLSNLLENWHHLCPVDGQVLSVRCNLHPDFAGVGGQLTSLSVFSLSAIHSAPRVSLHFLHGGVHFGGSYSANFHLAGKGGGGGGSTREEGALSRQVCYSF